MAEAVSAAATIRIDKWLWHARVAKSRSIAKSLVTSGKVRVNAVKVSAAGKPVKPGDVLTITLERRVLVHRISATGLRRGPASEARALYEDLTPPAESRPSADRPSMPAIRAEGSGRPTKKERRELTRFRSGIGEEF